MQFRPAKRDRRRPLIGLYSLSGHGKTYSALLLARGLVGAEGKIAMIDTENGRGSDYVDVIPGGYQVLDLDEPFSPARYGEAIDAMIKLGPDVGIIDSMSHEWEGVGSVTAMATDIEIKSGKSGLHCWKEPKMQHLRMMLKLLRAPFPVIVCLRAKRKSRQLKDDKGKTVIVKDEFATPKQDGDFIFEMTAHAEIMADHTLRVTKLGHPALAEVFKTGEMIGIATGEKLRAWTLGGASSDRNLGSSQPPPADKGREEPTKPPAAPSYHPGMAKLHKDLARELADAEDPTAWWRRKKKPLDLLKAQAPGLWEELRQVAAEKKAKGSLAL